MDIFIIYIIYHIFLTTYKHVHVIMKTVYDKVNVSDKALMIQS